MPLPALATKFAQSMDPKDLVDYQIDLAAKILETGEAVSSYTLTVLAEAAALGFTIAQGVADLSNAAYAPSLVNTNTGLLFWVYVNPTYVTDPAYDAGVTAGLELTVTTNSTPPRRRQRSFGIQVVQQ